MKKKVKHNTNMATLSLIFVVLGGGALFAQTWVTFPTTFFTGLFVVGILVGFYWLGWLIIKSTKENSLECHSEKLTKEETQNGTNN